MTDFAALEAGARARLDRMRRLAADLAAIRVDHTDAEGVITVSVDGVGRLLDVRLTQAIAMLSPSEFERVLVATAAAAVRRALGARGQLIDEFNGQVNS
ncbi:YbaB/EbfC family nucleoid-associated protein [Nocardia sp. NPDC051929]|uniref:YbaB/EbfC family nucleoid-associated protein n=1 Tax=Nocardia sp. NPDC051929 TaxID=3364327 RepID=UPI0037C542EE